MKPIKMTNKCSVCKKPVQTNILLMPQKCDRPNECPILKRQGPATRSFKEFSDKYLKGL